MKDFRGIIRRLESLERTVGHQGRSESEDQEAEVDVAGNNVNSILDEESFRNGFRTYNRCKQNVNDVSDDLFVLQENRMWNIYKTTVLFNKWIKCKPLITSDGRSPQLEFLLDDHLEVFYGGACGGGKSVALLAGALQFVDQERYNALLLRRRITDLSLPDALMDLAHRWLDGTDAKFDSKNNVFIFPSGARLVFGYCENLGDEQRYRSAQFQYIGIDELTEWVENQYLFLFSRLRRPRGLNVPLRMRCASNPGGAGHSWVKQRFIIGAKDVEDRVFIPAKLFDNPEIDQEGYMKSLMNLDPIRRAQIRDGNWDINPRGRKFQRGWFMIVQNYPKGGRIIRYWDKAATEPKKGKDPDYTVGVKATMVDGVFYVLHMERFRGTPKVNESTIRRIAELDGKEVDIYMEQEPGSAGVNDIDNYVRRILSGYCFRGEKTTGSKEIRANPLSSLAEQGNVRLVQAPWNNEFLDEFEMFPDGAHDDIVDATSGAFGMLTTHVPLGGGGVPSIFGN